jgi:ATP-dependent helicase HrpA
VRFEGGAKAFEQQLFEKVRRDLLHQDVRTRKAFEALAVSARENLMAEGQALRQAVLPVLEALHQVHEVLYRAGGQAAAPGGPLGAFLQARREEVQRLVPSSFVQLYGMERFPSLVRYLQAIAIRVERALVQFDRDQAKARDLRHWEDHLKALLDQLDARASDRRRTALEELFWMIEEYKVSLFAQELKTAMPISAKRLEKKVAEIRRMG